MKILRSSLTVLFFTLWSPVVAAAGAQDPGQAAKEFVRQGAAEYTKQHWEAARSAFLKAWELKQHYAIAANLGEVEIKLGLFREAAEHLKFALANLPEDHTDKRADAEASLKECRAHLSAVRVSVSVPGATVKLDGQDVAPDLLADELLLDPGAHTLQASKAGYLVSSREFVATAGESRAIRLDLAPQPPAADLAPAAAPVGNAPADKEDTASHGSPELWVLVGGGAATVVAAGFGTYFSLHESALRSDAKPLQTQIDQAAPSGTNSQCAPSVSMRPAACDMLAKNISERRSARTGATASWIAAGVLGAATVTTYLLWPTRGKESAGKQSHVVIAPWLLGARGGMVQVAF